MLKDNLSKDYLPGFPSISLYQHKKMFRVNTDTSLLGHYLKVKKGDRVLDIGTNNGALLLYASFYEPSLLVGIDINKDALEIAKLNLESNKIENFELVFSNIKDYINENKFDVIISNPPYFNTKNENLKNNNEYLKMARHEEYLLLEDLIKGVATNLKDDGIFYLIHTAPRLEEIKECLNKHNMYVIEYTKVRDINKDNDHVVLMTISKDANNSCIEKETIIVKR